MNGVGIFFIVLIVLLIAAAAGWVLFTQLRARRLGLPAPSLSSYNPFSSRSDPSPYGQPTPAPGGIRGWINDKFRSSNKRSAAGAYEQPGSNGVRSNRGFGALDPDGAWDTRIGNEADAYGGYYEEQELGNRHGGGNQYGNDPYSSSEYPMNLAATPGHAPEGYSGHHEESRGRSRDRDGLSVPGGGGRSRQNPFDDDAAEPSNISLRGVSPRPIDTSVGSRLGGGGPPSDSPTERKSIFRENV